MSPLGRLGLWWGLGGTALLLLDGVVRLATHVRALFTLPLDALELTTLIVWCALMGVAEGYRGFQRHFVPRVVGRALHLVRTPQPVLVACAPLFCMGLMHATRRRLIGAWSLLVGVVALILVVRTLEQPWRGIIDAGVLVGLSWGLVALCVETVRALRGRVPDVDLDLPAH